MSDHDVVLPLQKLVRMIADVREAQLKTVELLEQLVAAQAKPKKGAS